MTNKSPLSIKDRFEGFVEKTETCWLWKGGINSTGRGIFWLDGKTPKAHRISYLIYRGDIPKGMLVCHTCDNGKCVNPLHLFLGTHKDNTRDMHSKGRANPPRGKNHWRIKGKKNEKITN